MNFTLHLRDQLFFISIAITALLFIGLPDRFDDVLRYDRNAVAAGEWWRLLTANFLHLGWGHFWMNIAGLALVSIFFAHCLRPAAWIASFFICGTAISIAIFALNEDIIWFVGLSGVLHALFVVGGLADIRLRPWEGIIFLSLIAAKVTWEQFMGALPGSEDLAGGTVLTDAHFYGALCGLAIWPLVKRWATPS
jgi:rhomboid family GlyGly-CTERM serine protease